MHASWGPDLQICSSRPISFARAFSCSHAGSCMLMACSKIVCMHAHALVMHSNNRICWHSNFQLLLPSTWILKGNQPGPWKGINLDLGWGSTWTRDELNLALGWGSTWTRDMAHGNLARGMAQLGPGAGLNLDLDGPILESLVALCH